jgi:glucokinase
LKIVNPWLKFPILALESGGNVAEKVFAGVDIGGTKTAVVLSFELPRILTRVVFPTRPEEGPQFGLIRIVESLHQALAKHALSPADLAVIGVSCGGPLDPVRGLIQSPPNLITWKNVAICEVLSEEFHAPCYLENDANAGAIAEARFGAGRGFSNLIFLTMGTGLGAGLILNGQLHRGISHAAGEIGHVRLSENGPSGFGKQGTAEGWASGGGMAQVAQMFVKAAVDRGERTVLSGVLTGADTTMVARQVAEAAKAGDAVAKTIVQTVGEHLGEAMSILIDLLNPECIIVGGLALRFGEELLGPARHVIKRETLSGSAEVCRIIPAALGEQIGDIAALCTAIRGSL